MTFIIGASAHGSPGVSTALQVMAAQWPNPDAVPVVVEADAGGGVLAARFDITINPGMVTLAESLRKFETPNLLDHAQRLPSGVACVPLSPSASAVAAQLRSAGGFLGPYLRQVDHPVLLDAGALLPDSRIATAVANADLLLWFVRPTKEELLVLKHRLAETAQPDNVGIVLVGDLPYNAAQVAEALEVEVLQVLPIDPRAASGVNIGGDDRYLRRSPFARSCAQLTDQIQHAAAMRPAAAPKADFSHLPPPPAFRAPAEASPDITTELPARQAVPETEGWLDLTDPEEEAEVILWRPGSDGPADPGDPGNPGDNAEEPQPVVWFPEASS